MNSQKCLECVNTYALCKDAPQKFDVCQDYSVKLSASACPNAGWLVWYVLDTVDSKLIK